MTYDDLTNSVISIAGQDGNSGFTSQVPLMIELGEARTYRKLRDRRMLVNAYVLVLSTERPFLLPDDFLEAYGVWDGAQELVFVDPDHLLRNAEPLCPQWSISGNELVFNELGTPTDNTVLVYYAKPALLQISATGNQIFQNNPDLFLYASLAESIFYLRDEQRMGAWVAEWQARMAEMKQAAWDDSFPAAQHTVTRSR